MSHDNSSGHPEYNFCNLESTELIRLALSLRSGNRRSRSRSHHFAIANAPNYGLNKTIDSLVMWIIRIEKMKLWQPGFGFTGLNRQLSAQTIFDECRFVTSFRAIPGIHAQYRKIAAWSLGAARSRQQVLRSAASWIGYAIQLKPCHPPHTRGVGAFAAPA